VKDQRRGRRIAFSPEEIDAFLARELLCRVATIGPAGRLHNSPLWFVWVDRAIWLYSTTKSQRWTNIGRYPHVSVVVDRGTGFSDYAGLEIAGLAEQVGPAPWSGESVAELQVPARLYGEKYTPDTGFIPDGRHGWLRVEPEKIVSWDFRKLVSR
jgi:hypothetical protein